MREALPRVRVESGGRRSFIIPVILAGSLITGVYGLSRALERSGIDPVAETESNVSVCQGLTALSDRREAYRKAYRKYIVLGSGSMGHRFENLDRAARDCGELGSFYFDAGNSQDTEAPLGEPADAPVE